MAKNPFEFNPFSDSKFDFTKNIRDVPPEIEKREKRKYDEDALMSTDDSKKPSQQPSSQPASKDNDDDGESVKIF